MTLTFVNSETDPCLAAFLEEMRARHLNAERNDSGPHIFKDPRIEAMWEGFACGWIMRRNRNAGTPTYNSKGNILTRLAAITRKDRNELLPCYCGQRGSVEELYAGETYPQDNHQTESFLYSVTCRRRCHQTEWHETPEIAIDEWNDRPREVALIALVKEAAEDIYRLRYGAQTPEDEDVS